MTVFKCHSKTPSDLDGGILFNLYNFRKMQSYFQIQMYMRIITCVRKNLDGGAPGWRSV